PVQFATWLGLFLMWFYLTITITEHVFGATDPNSEQYADGLAWANLCFGYYSVVTFLFALFMPRLAVMMGNVRLHALCLLAGGIGLLSIALVHDKYVLLLSMTGVGIAWASIVSMPYAIIARDIPAKQMGIFMGLFNMFIVIPEVIAALGFGWVMRELLDNNKLHAVMTGGCFLLLAAILTLFAREKTSGADQGL
nr:MFS transporter [Chitinophagales bacterium]